MVIAVYHQLGTLVSRVAFTVDNVDEQHERCVSNMVGRFPLALIRSTDDRPVISHMFVREHWKLCSRLFGDA